LQEAAPLVGDHFKATFCGEIGISWTREDAVSPLTGFVGVETQRPGVLPLVEAGDGEGSPLALVNPAFTVTSPKGFS